MKESIIKSFEEKKELMKTLEHNSYLENVEKASDVLSSAIKNGNKILIAGNGGSAADAQHFAGEIVGRFMFNRPSAPALSLCVDPSVMTCIANDYGYDEVFARQIEGLGKSGDVFIGISTSGNSENILKALDKAKERNMKTVCFLGKDGGKIKSACDIPLVVPSNSTPRIQEIHTFTVHLLCEIIEKENFGE